MPGEARSASGAPDVGRQVKARAPAGWTVRAGSGNVRPRSLPRMDAAPPDKLNPQQRAAATHPADRPLLIIAGAGTGKTNTLAHRVAHLIATGIDPARILLLTFTRRAAAEMVRRVESI